MSDEYLFISDCHLDASRPEVTAMLANFLETRAVTARYVYILGDLFEVWLGDDDPAPEQQHVIGLLRQLGQNTDLFFMAGNRDFLLGKAFADANNITLLDEPHSGGFVRGLAGRRRSCTRAAACHRITASAWAKY